MKKKSAGFTLVEMIITVTIAAILTRIAYNAYSSYIMRSNRAVARGLLVSLAAKQEVQALQNGGYATTFGSISGYSDLTSAPFYINQNGKAQASSDGNTIYKISFASTPTATTTAFALQADAQGVQLRRDSKCATLVLSYTGQRNALKSDGTTSPDVSSCWEK